MSSGKFAKDLSGQKFGKLTVIERGPNYEYKNGKHKARWWCKCDCGNPNFTLVETYALKSGHTQSCGCIRNEKLSKMKKKYNDYDLSGEYGIGYTELPDQFGRNEFYFDLEDYDKIKNYCWRFSNGYLRTTINEKSVAMHRLILGVDESVESVDHIHGSTTTNDNRKSNLREATLSQNGQNRKEMFNNTSGVPGVYWRNDTLKWSAGIWVNGKHIALGCYEKYDDAVTARLAGENKYFGDFSYTNSRKKNEDR